jgi:hypothetical protein
MARAKKTAKKKKPTPGKNEPRRLSPAKLDEVIVTTRRTRASLRKGPGRRAIWPVALERR